MNPDDASASSGVPPPDAFSYVTNSDVMVGEEPDTLVFDSTNPTDVDPGVLVQIQNHMTPGRLGRKAAIIWCNVFVLNSRDDRMKHSPQVPTRQSFRTTSMLALLLRF